MSNIGPQLPPGFVKNDSQGSASEDDEDYGPCLPPPPDSDENNSTETPARTATIGPSIPSHLLSKPVVDNKSQSNNQATRLPNASSISGPALPPHLKSNEEDGDSELYGPTLPPNPVNNEEDGDSDSYGPALPPDYQKSDSDSDASDSDDGMIGPMPSTGRDDDYSAAAEFERRALLMKNKLTGKNEVKAPVRESWMMELPEAKVSTLLGLQARSFRTKAAQDIDHAGWTDTPADRARKQKEDREGKTSKPGKSDDIRIKRRDEEIASQVELYNKSRKESLVDLHHKQRKSQKETEDDGGPPKRRAFDRELDLKVNRFDDAKRKSVIKKSQELNTRFGHGSSKFI